MKNIKKIVFCSLFILSVPINTATIGVNLLSIKQMSQEEQSVLSDNATETTLKKPSDDKAVKLGADILTTITHLCFLCCLIKIIYQEEKHEIYKDIIHAK